VAFAGTTAFGPSIVTGGAPMNVLQSFVAPYLAARRISLGAVVELLIVKLVIA
jgi:hypothetical protein